MAEVEAVTPNGTSYPLTEGALLGSLRATDPSRSWTSHGLTVLPYHPYTEASSQPVVPGTTEEYQIQVFPTLVTLAAGDRLRVTISTTDTPHLVPIPSRLAQLVGGQYNIERTPASPSSLTVELDPALGLRLRRRTACGGASSTERVGVTSSRFGELGGLGR